MWRITLFAMCLSSVAYADTAATLHALGKRAQPKLPGTAVTCTAPNKTEAAALKKLALAWIEKQLPGERSSSDSSDVQFVFNARCKDLHAAYVSIAQDRWPKQGRGHRMNAVLKITGDVVESIASRTTTASEDWMEWADEGGYSIIAIVDNQVVWSDDEHEGGATATHANLRLRLPNGTDVPIAQVRNLVDVRLVDGNLAVAGQVDASSPIVYGCVGKDQRVKRCAELERVNARIAAANELASFTELPDRDLAATWLAAIGAKADLSSLPTAPASVIAQRHVTAFVDAVQVELPFEIFQQANPEAEAFLAQLSAKLGDTSCKPSDLSEVTRAALTKWAEKQGGTNLGFEGECGTYAWVTWDRKGDQRTENLVELDGAEPVRVAKFRVEQDEGGVTDHHSTCNFFQHGDTAIGVCIHSENLAVIANAKIVAQSHGTIAMYRFADSTVEHSNDLIVDSGTIMHATPTGLEKLDRTLVADHEARRAALERLISDPPSSDPKYLAALRTLGASAKLVAECKALV